MTKDFLNIALKKRIQSEKITATLDDNSSLQILLAGVDVIDVVEITLNTWNNYSRN